MEKQLSLKSRLGALVFAGTAFTLSGCGAVNSAINSIIPEIDDLVKLNGKSIEATVGTGRAVLSGNVGKSGPLDDTELPQADKLKSMKLRQSLAQNVTVTMPGSAAFPASFKLSNITLKITLSDSQGTAEASATLAGPVTFTRQGTTSTYQASTTAVEISNIAFTSTNFEMVRNIITMPPSPNTAAAKLSFDADDTELPSGSKLTFTFSGGKAKVEL